MCPSVCSTCFVALPRAVGNGLQLGQHCDAKWSPRAQQAQQHGPQQAQQPVPRAQQRQMQPRAQWVHHAQQEAQQAAQQARRQETWLEAGQEALLAVHHTLLTQRARRAWQGGCQRRRQWGLRRASQEA